MRFSASPAFERSLKDLDPERQRRARDTLTAFVRALESSGGTPGLGLKQLRHGLWEIRSGLLDRILFRWHKDSLQFIIVGTHDEIRRYLKNL